MGQAAGAQITKAPDALERSQGKRPKSANPHMKKQTQVRNHGSKPAAHGPGQSPRCAVRDEVGKRPMTSWPYGLLRPAGSGGRVSR
jgi:hypothetical protein